MLRSIFILSILILSAVNAYADLPLLPKAVLVPSASAAVSDDAMATIFNPAGLGVERGTNGYYLHTFSGEAGGDNAFFISSLGLGFGAEYANPAQVGFTKYTLSDGTRVYGGLYLGSSYSWFSSADEDYDRLSSWDLGLLARPSSFLSIGLVARNLNRPTFFESRTSRTYDLSFAFRPYTDRITFSVDARFREEGKIKDAKAIYALECEPIDGVIFRGSYNSDDNFDLRIGIGSAYLELGAYSQFDNDWNRGSGAAYTRLSSERYRTSVPTGRYFLELETEDLARERVQDSLLRRAGEDEAIDGMILKLGLSGYSMGKLQEMRDAIMDFRASGKKAICYMEMAGNKEYYLAAACDRLVINPAGYLSLNGLRSEVTFYKGALDKLGIKADLYHIGKYKSASEMFTREGMSDAYRESLNSFLDDVSDQMVTGIAKGRGMSYAEMLKRIDEGPYTAKEAMKAALVDELVYTDQLGDIAEQEFGENTIKLSGKEYESYKYHYYAWSAKPKLAVIYAAGMMAPGRSMFNDGSPQAEATGSLLPQIMGSETIAEAIKEAREDGSIKAIVLRIDSGGGSVFASDVIWREVMLAKDEKPVIVSMGGVAASGGYYIACPADVIVAEPGTMTGSIGVLAGKFSFRGLYDKLGITKEILKRGKNSDIFTIHRDFTDEQREIINRHIKEMYNDFVGKVAQGRDMAEEAVESFAQGRIWTGRQAKNNGLVDELGGLHLAVSLAKSRAGLESDESVDIVAFPKRIPLWNRFISGEVFFVPEPLNLMVLSDVMKATEGLANEKLFFLMPYTLDYR